MTIITKPITEKKNAKAGVEKPLVVVGDSGTRELGNADVENRNDLNHLDMELWLSPSLRRRISASSTVCVFITTLMVASIMIIGSVYLHRQMIQNRKMSRFRGWCGIPYDLNALRIGQKDHLLGPNKPFFKENNDAEIMSSDGRFRQDFDIDLDSGLYERIDVPDFGIGRAGQFIHDFQRNKTGIIDKTSKRCFVMDLDRTHVKPPHSMFELVTRMWNGYYNVDTRVIRRNMRVVQPPIEDLNTQGSYIAHNCAGFTTFRLEEASISGGKRDRRSAHKSTKDALTFVEFAGEGIIKYDLVSN